MKRAQYILMLAVLSLWSVTVLPLDSHSQALKDCREGSGCTAADLANTLFPGGGRERETMRGLGPAPQKEEASKPAAPAPVALKVEFDTNSDTIRPQYYSDLNELGKVLAQPQHAAYHIQIEGHTDSIGSEQRNQVLSKKRAESVKRYLLQHFPIKRDNLSAVGYGKSQPIASNDTPEGRSKNRRVQVVNLGQ